MTPRQTIFISAVTRELYDARKLVAETLYQLGYEPIWQDVFGTEHGDLRQVLRKKIDGCKGLIQLVGHRYGAEPRVPCETSGRMSYTQFEASHARQQGKKVWYLVDISPPPAESEAEEPQELQALQKAYRESLRRGKGALYHKVALRDDDSLKVMVYAIKDDLAKLRRGFRIWTASVTAMLALLVCLVAWGQLTNRASRTPEVTEANAQTSFISKDHAKAFHDYVALSAKDPANINYHRRIEDCARLGSLQKPFLDHYLSLVAKQPDNPLFQNYLGNARLMLDPADREGKARSCYESALRLDPKFAPPLANLGILASRSGNQTEALSLLQRYLAAQPDDSQAWVNLAMLHVARIKSDKNDTAAVLAAETALSKAILIDPGSAPAYRALAKMHAAAGRMNEAADACRRSLTLNPDQPDLRNLLANELGATEQPEPPADDLQTRGMRAAPVESHGKNDPSR